MSRGVKEKMGFVIDPNGLRPFEEADLPRIAGFLLVGKSLGDILCMTPMVEAAIGLLGKNLDVWTWQDEIFRDHPRVKARPPEPEALDVYLRAGHLLFVAPTGTVQEAFESHAVEGYAAGIIDLLPHEKQIVLYSAGPERASIQNRLAALPMGRKRVLIHPSANHPIRTYPQERWTEIAKNLVKDFAVINIGKDIQYNWLAKQPFELQVNDPNFCDWRNRLSLHELYELIRASDLVVTFDSGVLHVASATQTPVVAIFSDMDPAFRMGFDSQGNLGSRTTLVSAPCPFQFCTSRFGYNDDKCRTQETAFMQCLPSAPAVIAAARAVLG